MSQWFLDYPICHRGAHWFAGIDENSYESFEKAISLGLPFEIDVHLSRDGEVFIHHDTSFERVGRRKIDLTQRSSEELFDLRTPQSNYGVMLLKDLLILLKGQVPLVIEIKHNRKDYLLEERLLETLEGYKGEYALQCFHPFVIKYLKEKKLNCPLGLLAGPLKEESIHYFFKVFVKSLCMAPKLAPDYIGYQWDCLALRAPKRMREHFDIPLIGWTVKDQDAYDFTMRFADNIIFENLKF